MTVSSTLVFPGTKQGLHLVGRQLRSVTLVALAVGTSALVIWAWQESPVLHLEDARCSPCLRHPLGCDAIGRSLLARILQGASVSVLIGAAAALIDVFIGTLVASACLLHRRLDQSICALLDIGYGLPYLVLAAVLASWSASSWLGTLVALILVGWIPAARLLRGSLFSLAACESIITARSMGLPRRRLFVELLWPRCLPTVTVHLAAAIPQAILAESLLSFLGLGIRPPLASLGGLCQNGLLFAWECPWMAYGPIAALVLLQFSALWLAERTSFRQPARQHAGKPESMNLPQDYARMP
jgi:oligopeptide transport system permease protein